MVTREQIVEEAHRWLGVPYRADGRTRETGVDCTGLMVAILRELGEDPQDQLGLGRFDHFQQMCAAIEKECDQVDFWEPGDLIVFRYRLMPNHTGVFVGKSHFIHADMRIGKVVKQFIDNRWLERVARVYRYRGLA